MTEDRKEKLKKKREFLLARGEQLGVALSLLGIAGCALIGCIGAGIGISWLAITGLVATVLSYLIAGVTKMGEVFVDIEINKIEKLLDEENATILTETNEVSQEVENTSLIERAAAKQITAKAPKKSQKKAASEEKTDDFTNDLY